MQLAVHIYKQENRVTRLQIGYTMVQAANDLCATAAWPFVSRWSNQEPKVYSRNRIDPTLVVRVSRFVLSSTSHGDFKDLPDLQRLQICGWLDRELRRKWTWWSCHCAPVSEQGCDFTLIQRGVSSYHWKFEFARVDWNSPQRCELLHRVPMHV